MSTGGAGWGAWAKAASVCLLAGCGGGAPAGPPPPSPAAHRNVMVIDEGIDLTSTDLQGKVAAAFTIVCDAGPQDAGPQEDPSDGGADAGADGGAPSFEEVKRDYISRLGVASQACGLEPGISAKTDPLAAIAQYRARWNGMVRGQRFRDSTFTDAEWTEITGVMDTALASFTFHGTSTASTAAHDNAGVRLVLIERSLADPTKMVDDFVCLTQARLDQSVALLSDPDVRDAYVHSPNSRYTNEFFDVVHEFDVGIISLSYGSASRQELDLLQQMKGCPSVDSRAYFSVLHDLAAASLASAPPKPYVVIQSAGNESETLDSGADSMDCVPEDPRHLLVGSTTLIGTPSRFSNVGACVNVTAPGENVIAPYAGGWLLVDDGTSFAAPLIARYLSLTAAEPFDATDARAALLARLAPAETLSFSSVPRDFFYAPAGPAATVSALTGTSAHAEAARTRALRRLARVDFAPVLAPLRALPADRP